MGSEQPAQLIVMVFPSLYMYVICTDRAPYGTRGVHLQVFAFMWPKHQDNHGPPSIMHLTTTSREGDFIWATGLYGFPSLTDNRSFEAYSTHAEDWCMNYTRNYINETNIYRPARTLFPKSKFKEKLA